MLKETVGFFLSGLGHGKVSYEIVNALECFGHPPAVIAPNAHSRGWEGNQVEGIYPNEAPELGACCVLGYSVPSK